MAVFAFSRPQKRIAPFRVSQGKHLFAYIPKNQRPTLFFRLLCPVSYLKCACANVAHVARPDLENVANAKPRLQRDTENQRPIRIELRENRAKLVLGKVPRFHAEL